MQRKGLADEAADCFQKSLGLNPNNFDACRHLADALKERGRFDEAALYYQKALEIDPKPLMPMSCITIWGCLFRRRD
jgi:tetratricopeptide (TPR) repeat protein